MFDFAASRPYAFGTPWTIGVHAQKQRLDFEEVEGSGLPAYSRDEGALRLQAQRPIGARSELWAGYAFSTVTLETVDAAETPAAGLRPAARERVVLDLALRRLGPPVEAAARRPRHGPGRVVGRHRGLRRGAGAHVRPGPARRARGPRRGLRGRAGWAASAPARCCRSTRRSSSAAKTTCAASTSDRSARATRRARWSEARGTSSRRRRRTWTSLRWLRAVAFVDAGHAWEEGGLAGRVEPARLDRRRAALRAADLPFAGPIDLRLQPVAGRVSPARQVQGGDRALALNQRTVAVAVAVTTLAAAGLSLGTHRQLGTMGAFQSTWFDLGLNVAAAGVFGSESHPTVYKPPGYPLFIAGAVRLFAGTPVRCDTCDTGPHWGRLGLPEAHAGARRLGRGLGTGAGARVCGGGAIPVPRPFDAARGGGTGRAALRPGPAAHRPRGSDPLHRLPPVLRQRRPRAPRPVHPGAARRTPRDGLVGRPACGGASRRSCVRSRLGCRPSCWRRRL